MKKLIAYSLAVAGTLILASCSPAASQPAPEQPLQQQRQIPCLSIDMFQEMVLAVKLAPYAIVKMRGQSMGYFMETEGTTGIAVLFRSPTEEQPGAVCILGKVDDIVLMKPVSRRDA